MKGLRDLDLYREDARRGLSRLLDTKPRSNSEILAQNLALASDETLFPAALCLGVADCLGAPASRASACAAAAGFLFLALAVVTDSARRAEGGEPVRATVPGWGLPLTLNAGDGLLSLAHSAILDSSAASGGLDSQGVVRALSVLDDASLRVAETVRLHLAGRRSSERDDLAHASRVTMARSGAALGGISAAKTSDEEIAGLSAYGEAIAMARGHIGAASIVPRDGLTAGVRDAVETLRRAGLPAAATEALLSFAASILRTGSA